MNQRFVFLLVVVIFIYVLAPYQASSRRFPPPADTSRAKLNFLAGSFSTELTLPAKSPGQKATTAKGTSTITWGLDSMFLLIDDQNSLFGKYKAHGVLGYEAQTHQYVLSMFNSYGDHPTYKGEFAGDTLVLQTKVPLPGNSFDQKIVWYKDGQTVRLRILNDFGKGFTPAIEQTGTPFSGSTK